MDSHLSLKEKRTASASWRLPLRRRIFFQSEEGERDDAGAYRVKELLGQWETYRKATLELKENQELAKRPFDWPKWPWRKSRSSSAHPRCGESDPDITCCRRTKIEDGTQSSEISSGDGG